MTCYEELAEWKKLENNTTLMLDPSVNQDSDYAVIDIDGVWTRKRWREHHLGPLLRVSWHPEVEQRRRNLKARGRYYFLR